MISEQINVTCQVCGLTPEMHETPDRLQFVCHQTEYAAVVLVADQPSAGELVGFVTVPHGAFTARWR